jgi:hypothetical protein
MAVVVNGLLGLIYKLLLVKKRKGIDRRKNVNAQRFASYGQ